MQVETLIRNFRTNHGMGDNDRPIAFLGNEINIRKMGGDLFLDTKLKAEIKTPEGWLDLLRINLANQKRLRHSIGFDEENAALVLWRKIPMPPSQSDFDAEVEQFASGIKYWGRCLKSL